MEGENKEEEKMGEKEQEKEEESMCFKFINCSGIGEKKKTSRANGEEKTQEGGKRRRLKHNSRNIEYVLAALKKKTSDVRNSRRYVITALYNAPVTMSSFYRAEVNHDMFGKR